jgi:hypothetical protein
MLPCAAQRDTKYPGKQNNKENKKESASRSTGSRCQPLRHTARSAKTSKRLTAILASEAFGFLLLLGLESAGAGRAYSLGV